MMRHENEKVSVPYLDAKLAELTTQGHAIEAELVAFLAAFIAAEGHRELGYRSTYAYVITKLGFRRDVALLRLAAAKALVAQPSALKPLVSGTLSVSSLAALAPIIDEDAVAYAIGRPTRAVKSYVALRRSQSVRTDKSAVSSSAGAPLRCAMPLTLVAKAQEVARLLTERQGGSIGLGRADIYELMFDRMLQYLRSEEENAETPAGAPAGSVPGAGAGVDAEAPAAAGAIAVAGTDVDAVVAGTAVVGGGGVATVGGAVASGVGGAVASGVGGAVASGVGGAVGGGGVVTGGVTVRSGAAVGGGGAPAVTSGDGAAVGAAPRAALRAPAPRGRAAHGERRASKIRA